MLRNLFFSIVLWLAGGLFLYSAFVSAWTTPAMNLGNDIGCGIVGFGGLILLWSDIQRYRQRA